MWAFEFMRLGAALEGYMAQQQDAERLHISTVYTRMSINVLVIY